MKPVLGARAHCSSYRSGPGQEDHKFKGPLGQLVKGELGYTIPPAGSLQQEDCH